MTCAVRGPLTRNIGDHNARPATATRLVAHKVQPETCSDTCKQAVRLVVLPSILCTLSASRGAKDQVIVKGVLKRIEVRSQLRLQGLHSCLCQHTEDRVGNASR